MAKDIEVRNPALGLNSEVTDPFHLPRGSAADKTKNMLYEDGVARTAFGCQKVFSGALPLDSGNPILHFGLYGDLDLTQHLQAFTKDKVYRKDNESSTWTDITGPNAVGASLFSPISVTSVLHTDGIALNGSGALAYKHSVFCPGDSAPIQRWAGKHEDDYAYLEGGDGYHDVSASKTHHWAKQVGSLRNHVLLIAAKEADANDSLVETPHRIRWGATGKLEVFDGDGTGYVDLFETGGHNVWGAKLGNSIWVQYQNNSIWSLNWVGGKTVFRSNIEVPELGLLSPHLFASRNNVHYFVGDDHKVYAYQGGANLQPLSDKIHNYIERDLSDEWAMRSWLVLGPNSKRLWLFYCDKVDSNEFCVDAFVIDTRSGAWSPRNFAHKYTTTSTGITAAARVGSGSYQTGPSYAEILGTSSPAKAVAIGGCVRSANVVTVTTAVAHGFITGESAIVADVDSGGESTAFSGTHTIASVPSTTTFTYSQSGANESNLAAGTAKVDKSPTYTDYANAQTTYREMLTTVLSDEKLVIGDNVGNVLEFDEDLTEDDGIGMPAQHITEVYGFDGSSNGLWPRLHVTAKGTGMNVGYRTSGFLGADTGWTTLATLSLTSEFVTYDLFPHINAKKIQFKFWAANNDFQISQYAIGQPVKLGRS